MKSQMIIEHIATRRRWCGKVVDTSVDTSVTEADIEAAIKDVTNSLSEAKFITMGDDVLPGDFVRQHCVITFWKE